ncbi:protein kinase [Sphaerisporangium sp. NPDC005289]|uniref:serine/threonine-protein kinase n=1 Tax=Sphaerisporangium sp. NPDC005289 TaxID=3155247 RepID=UPI0033A6C042
MLFLLFLATSSYLNALPDHDWRNTVAGFVWVPGVWFGGTVHAFIIRRAVFRPRVAPFRPPAGPPVTYAHPAPDVPPHAPQWTARPSWQQASHHHPPPVRDPWGTVPGAARPATNELGPLGPYRLLSRLGEGGQGTVYLAQAPDGREVAVKVLHARLHEAHGERDRFMREVLTARRVPPYATARVIDVGVADDRAYVVSEYVPGPSLDALVRRQGRPLDSDGLIRLAIATSAALAGIHAAGVVHRDFKPANVLLGPDGPRVIDFGVARALDHVTTSGGMKGTPAYMSPEQVSGRPAGLESDLFSWGATMFYGATGAGPFRGDTPYQLFSAILSYHPNISVLPPMLVGPVAACLDKEPHNRPTAAELMLAIVQ